MNDSKEIFRPERVLFIHGLASSGSYKMSSSRTHSACSAVYAKRDGQTS